MCIICLEFNKSKDFGDAKLMIEAARRETNVISEEHLRRVEYKLQKMQDSGDEEEIDPEDKD
jgi:hypothetical protein